MRIGLDTNLLVRWIVNDDPRQVSQVRQLFANLKADQVFFVSLIVLVELAWVLRRNYGYTLRDVAYAIDRLCTTRFLEIEEQALVMQGLDRLLNDNADLADALIAALNVQAGCATTYTFDKSASKIPGMTFLSPGPHA